MQAVTDEIVEARGDEIDGVMRTAKLEYVKAAARVYAGLNR